MSQVLATIHNTASGFSRAQHSETPHRSEPIQRAEPARTAPRKPDRQGRQVRYLLAGLVGLLVGAGVGFGVAWLLFRSGAASAGQLLAQVQQLQQQHQGLQQQYEGTLQDLRSNNMQLSDQLRSARSEADNERSKGEQLLQQLRSGEQNIDLNALLGGDVADAAANVLELLADPSSRSPRENNRNWRVQGSTKTKPFRIRESAWQLSWQLLGDNPGITIRVFRDDPTRGQEQLIDTISSPTSDKKRIQSSPGMYYLDIQTRGEAEVAIVAAD